MAVMENELAGDALQSLFIDKAVIRRIVAEQNAKSGFVPDPTATPQRAQALVKASLLAQSINPEDNIFSQGIIDARDEK